MAISPTNSIATDLVHFSVQLDLVLEQMGAMPEEQKLEKVFIRSTNQNESEAFVKKEKGVFANVKRFFDRLFSKPKTELFSLESNLKNLQTLFMRLQNANQDELQEAIARLSHEEKLIIASKYHSNVQEMLNTFVDRVEKIRGHAVQTLENSLLLESKESKKEKLQERIATLKTICLTHLMAKEKKEKDLALSGLSKASQEALKILYSPDRTIDRLSFQRQAMMEARQICVDCHTRILQTTAVVKSEQEELATSVKSAIDTADKNLEKIDHELLSMFEIEGQNYVQKLQEELASTPKEKIDQKYSELIERLTTFLDHSLTRIFSHDTASVQKEKFLKAFVHKVSDAFNTQQQKHKRVVTADVALTKLRDVIAGSQLALTSSDKKAAVMSKEISEIKKVLLETIVFSRKISDEIHLDPLFSSQEKEARITLYRGYIQEATKQIELIDRELAQLQKTENPQIVAAAGAIVIHGSHNTVTIGAKSETIPEAARQQLGPMITMVAVLGACAYTKGGIPGMGVAITQFAGPLIASFVAGKIVPAKYRAYLMPCVSMIMNSYGGTLANRGFQMLWPQGTSQSSALPGPTQMPQRPSAPPPPTALDTFVPPAEPVVFVQKTDLKETPTALPNQPSGPTRNAIESEVPRIEPTPLQVLAEEAAKLPPMPEVKVETTESSWSFWQTVDSVQGVSNTVFQLLKPFAKTVPEGAFPTSAPSIPSISTVIAPAINKVIQ